MSGMAAGKTRKITHVLFIVSVKRNVSCELLYGIVFSSILYGIKFLECHNLAEFSVLCHKRYRYERYTICMCFFLKAFIFTGWFSKYSHPSTICVFLALRRLFLAIFSVRFRLAMRCSFAWKLSDFFSRALIACKLKTVDSTRLCCFSSTEPCHAVHSFTITTDYIGLR